MPFRTSLFAILISFTFSIFSQNKDHVYIHPFSNSIGFGLEGGVTYSSTDFQSNRFDYLGRGMIEYFFNSNSIGTFGLRLHGGISYVSGEGGVSVNDDRYSGLKTLKTDVYHIGGGYSYTISLSEIVYPYLFAGLSYIQFYPTGDNNLRISSIDEKIYSQKDINYDGELGLRFLIHDNFSINMSGAVHFNPNDNLDGIWGNDNNDIFYSANIGMSYYFNDAKDSDADGVEDSEDFCPDTPPHLNVDEFGCPIDSDNDGVPDQLDLCPETQISVVVDTNGCPLDLDKDGIADNLDHCLYTPLGIEVDSNGCPIDMDGDGIPDFFDKCPQTPLGYLVDSLGCPDIIYDSTFNRVIISDFSFADKELPMEAKEILNAIVGYMKKNEVFKWAIEGHADSISVDCENNYKISLGRAKTVYNILIGRGIDKSILSYAGFSNFRPISANNSESGRRRNRRVEIIKLRK